MWHNIIMFLNEGRLEEVKIAKGRCRVHAIYFMAFVQNTGTVYVEVYQAWT